MIIPGGKTCLVTQLNLGLATPNAATTAGKVAQGITIKGTSHISQQEIAGAPPPSRLLINPKSPSASRCSLLQNNINVEGGIVMGPSVAYINIEDLQIQAGPNLRSCIISASHKIGSDPTGDPINLRFRRVGFIGNGATTNAGLYLGNAGWVTVEQSVFAGSRYAILQDGDGNYLVNSIFTGNLVYPISSAVNTQEAFVSLGATAGLLFNGNSFENGPNALYIGTMFGGEVTSNWFNPEREFTTSGIWIDVGCAGCTIKGNWMTSGFDGILSRGNDGGIVSGNYFFGLMGTPLRIFGGSLTVEGNSFDYPSTGTNGDRADIDVMSGKGHYIGPNSYHSTVSRSTRYSMNLSSGTSGTLVYDSSTDHTKEGILDRSNGRWNNIGSGRVGIGTINPKTNMEVASGDIYASGPGKGLILRSPNGIVCKRVGIDDNGALVATSISCP